MRVELPWPPRVLHPNARPHWAQKARAAKKYRQDCAWAAALSGMKRVEADALTVAITFCPPNRRRRDMDGMLTCIKNGLDGVADIVGVDDSRWSLTLMRGEPARGGLVVLDIEPRTAS